MDVCEILEDYNPTKNKEVLIVFDDMRGDEILLDMKSDK